MTAPKFKTGDVVQLRSGGPKMTVRGYDEYVTEPRVVCEWIPRPSSTKLSRAVFPEEMLMLVLEDTARP